MKTKMQSTRPTYADAAKAAVAAANLSAAEPDPFDREYTIELMLVGVQAGVNAPAAATNAIYCVRLVDAGAMTDAEAVAYCDGSSQKGVR